MFIKYQKVRNVVVGAAMAIAGGVAVFFVLRDNDKTPRSSPSVPVATATEQVGQTPTTSPTTTSSNEATNRNPSTPTTVSTTTSVAPPPPADRQPPRKDITEQDRYVAAMKIASAKSAVNGKGKDVLGPGSPWKLNLYDDDQDGQWDRAKLDVNRDEVDDEKWNFKQGRWEKDGGATVWAQNRWVGSATAKPAASVAVTRDSPSPQLTRYRNAMQIATSRAAASGKGKDVLGSSSPWKLNLYDDDKDGHWDRAKLDYDRDEVDDEKWNFKHDRWEKDGGATIWNGSDWVPSAP